MTSMSRPGRSATGASSSSMARALAILALLLLGWTAPLNAAPEGTMTWGLHVTLASRWLDPAETEALITPFMVLYAIHDALVKPMPAGPNTPSLAESWSVSKDGLTYEFVLRKLATFHNGDPVSADDVKFSFERYKGAAAKLLKEKVREIQVVDARRVRFHLKEPWPDFMTFYGTSASGAAWIVPKKYVEKVGDDGFKRAPVGAGPYKFVSFQPGIELVLEAFDGYWRKIPHVKRIVLKSVPDAPGVSSPRPAIPTASTAAISRRIRPTTPWGRPSRTTWPPWASRPACASWSAPPCSRPGATRSCAECSWGPPARRATPPRAS